MRKNSQHMCVFEHPDIFDCFFESQMMDGAVVQVNGIQTAPVQPIFGQQQFMLHSDSGEERDAKKASQSHPVFYLFHDSINPWTIPAYSLMN